jgi:hypothetical protein
VGSSSCSHLVRKTGKKNPETQSWHVSCRKVVLGLSLRASVGSDASSSK